LEIAKRDNAKILFTSTSEVYGEPLQHPQSEEYRGNVNTIGIRACYDEGKRCAESLYFDYKRNFNLDIKIVRIFNTYGTNMRKDDGRVISNFINQMLENKDITIYGDGTQTRSFCFVDDMINALILMMKSKYSGPFNLGNPEEFTINDLVDKLLTLIDTKSNIVFKDLPKDDPTKRRPNIEKAKEFLKWKPTIKLNEGLIKTIEYYKNAK
jgi:UDP-glucuronate decarboxylase